MKRIWDDRSVREPMTLCEMKSRGRVVSKMRGIETFVFSMIIYSFFTRKGLKQGFFGEELVSKRRRAGVGNRAWRYGTNYTSDKIPRTRVTFTRSLEIDKKLGIIRG